MKNFWEERYGKEEFAYGIKPNVFFKNTLEKYQLSGSILLPAEGEGRNAVYAAKKGLNVTCFDMSSQGKLKALKLAKLNNVNINYLVGEFSKLHFEENSFDAIVLIYAHFPANLKTAYHKKLTTYLKKGGLLILEGFSEKQLKINEENQQAFGPKNIDMLYTIESIKNDFKDLEVQVLSQELIDLDEGIHHIGKGDVIRFIGKKQ
ncbi:class I SAM-dependent methyltransferase [Lutibacter sp. A80]|uniref:class I SAM-dependent methyltransferase n=1 Tax=Lutibacter sp. A80 TaxID=2918453 RepID=UPI001F058285|nr:class I SAM-dependent methyltransferase [Lutibacter sp. A80]UMB59329.1 class I SAM-dependent methyltransferase [Lutibacter sp. A80]